MHAGLVFLVFVMLLSWYILIPPCLCLCFCLRLYLAASSLTPTTSSHFHPRPRPSRIFHASTPANNNRLLRIPLNPLPLPDITVTCSIHRRRSGMEDASRRTL
ncbi:hypothetical protein LXA43DRAFT_122663 [Ganoderma leucocontextum]|nr:hypothetical protein LXA43DRAFT_122663 [Ganoderma leucocontextum]